VKIRVALLWTTDMTAADGPYVVEVSRDTITGITKVHETDSGGADVTTSLTAVPGYVDCHDHIGIDVGDERAQSFEEAPRMVIRGVRALTAMVDGGVTTVRSCGERADVEAYWIEAIDDGTLPGPRVVRSVTPICRTGGHAWYLGAQADGVDAIKAAVRRNVRDGADFIKVMATGGLGTIGSSPDTAEFTP
jgi:imidazolonepropionase-like amidohydrolase